MGVPAFFRWLSRKYPSIVVHAREEEARIIDGVKVPVDITLPNPNNFEFDNLYLDMNGIIHPCCHPENKPAPKNEEEMMEEIFEYIDRLMSIVRPRKLLYMAIDGVAPRAKMNQQRSRRFRASKESNDHREEVFQIKESLRAKGIQVPEDKKPSEHFDSNCITPGTNFMFHLADCLRYYIHHRLNNAPGWKNLIVILSDANVPGEGEHKIMDFIRRQRAMPDHNPNTKHCLCGADADLIMLGLATHETSFTIIREEFKPHQERPCEICGQTGHEFKECQGNPRPENEDKICASKQEFIFLRLNILREYLYKDLNMLNLPFKQDLERAIDDWVLMCFFVGNDFLPHLPSLEIREGAIDKLLKIYKTIVYKTGGYLTKDGSVNLERVQLMLDDLGEMEDAIFKRRRENELNFKRRNAYQKTQHSWVPQGPVIPLGSKHASKRSDLFNNNQMDSNNQMNNNEKAASDLKEFLKQEGSNLKRKFEDEEEEKEDNDEVKLWEDGWKERYYMSKFSMGSDELSFRHTVANEYVLGICWVFKYYYQGCASWNWYFPYHYAPFASDFKNISKVDVTFPPKTQPFKPLEQLMGVFPAASKQFLPPSWQDLMFSGDSPIIDFYPTDFKIDLNGKKYAWQGVALLPFVDEKRLLDCLKDVYEDLTDEEKKRNSRGKDLLFVGNGHSVYQDLVQIYSKDPNPSSINPKNTNGVSGEVAQDENVVLPHTTLVSPLPQLEDHHDNMAICVKYTDPVFEDGFVFKCSLLPNAKLPPPVLKPADLDGRTSWRSQTGFTKDNNYRNFNNPTVMQRHITANIPSNNDFRSGNFKPQSNYTNYAPPRNYNASRDNYNYQQAYNNPQPRRSYERQHFGYQQHNNYNRPQRNYHQTRYQNPNNYQQQMIHMDFPQGVSHPPFQLPFPNERNNPKPPYHCRDGRYNHRGF